MFEDETLNEKCSRFGSCSAVGAQSSSRDVFDSSATQNYINGNNTLETAWTTEDIVNVR